jgi:hypothetical protein
MARASWSGETWSVTDVEGSAASVDNVHAESLAGLPDAVRMRLAVHEQLPTEQIEVLVCSSKVDVDAWLRARIAARLREMHADQRARLLQ